MSGHILLNIDGHLVRVKVGSSVAAALRVASGMGVCQECRVLVDGRRRLACQTVCIEGMRVETTE